MPPHRNKKGDHTLQGKPSPTASPVPAPNPTPAPKPRETDLPCDPQWRDGDFTVITADHVMFRVNSWTMFGAR
jgi:hypothetical protein